ncbi:low molecular weight protein tyrosine phosphatase family protein [Variovorax paradoxus]|nr:low molecular weight protein tyrosine phosphatase family protein [Variovorax paradoxus]
MLHALFICSRNRLRSPTAAQVFSTMDDVETDSAGLAADAECPISLEQLVWADVIFVMEKVHRGKLSHRFGRHLNGKKVICLDIPDNYDFMQPELVALLERKVSPHLRAQAR